MTYVSRLERGGASALAHRREYVVIVVDDDAFTRKALLNALSQYPCRTIEASTGLEALRLINQAAPDLVLLDVRMPVMGGLELLQELRSSPRFRDLPVIALSGNADRKIVLEFIELGITSFLVKPLFREALLRRLDPVFESLERGEAPVISRPARSEDTRAELVIADADGNFRGFARSLLEGRLHVLEAQTGVEAYDLISRNRPNYALIGAGLPLLNENVLSRILRSENIETKLLLFAGNGSNENIDSANFHSVFKRTFLPDSFLADLSKAGVLRSEANASLSEVLIRDVSSPLVSAVQQCLGVLANMEVHHDARGNAAAIAREVAAKVTLVAVQGSGQFTIAITCSKATAESLGGSILGGPTTLDEGALEALAEVVNTVGGRVREALGNCGQKFDLHFPSVGECKPRVGAPPDLSFVFSTNTNERFVVDVEAGE